MSSDPDELQSMVTLTSASHDITSVKGLMSFLEATELKMSYPSIIECPYCKDTLTIRSLDDFPYKSVMCKCRKVYLLKLVKVHDGIQKTL